MDIYILTRDNAIKQVVKNMLDAQVIIPEEADMFAEQLWRLDSKDLVAVLLESCELREQEPKRINFYPLDVDAISKN